MAMFLVISLPRKRRSLQPGTAYLTATLTATGVSLVLMPLSAFGLQTAAYASLGTGFAQWPAWILPSWVTTNAIWLSVLPIVGVYSLAGTTQRRVPAGILLGLMTGYSAYLIAEAIRPLADVLWVPGIGFGDQVWLGFNGFLGLALAIVAARRA